MLTLYGILNAPESLIASLNNILIDMKEGDQPSPLSYDSVFGYIFKKLGDTIEKYRGILSQLDELEQAIVSHDTWRTL